MTVCVERMKVMAVFVVNDRRGFNDTEEAQGDRMGRDARGFMNFFGEAERELTGTPLTHRQSGLIPTNLFLNAVLSKAWVSGGSQGRLRPTKTSGKDEKSWWAMPFAAKVSGRREGDWRSRMIVLILWLISAPLSYQHDLISDAEAMLGGLSPKHSFISETVRLCVSNHDLQSSMQ